MTPDIDFTDEVIIQHYVPVVKKLFYMLVIYKISQISFDVKTYGGLMYCIWTQFFVYIVLVS